MMTDKEQLKEEQSEDASAGFSFGDDNFEKATQLLKEAADRALSVLGSKPYGLWHYINYALSAATAITRKEDIQRALSELESCKGNMSADDYYFIKDKLDQSNDLIK